MVCTLHNPPIAQLVEPASYTRMVLGSSPSGWTKDTNTCPSAGFVLLSEAQPYRFSDCEPWPRVLSIFRAGRNESPRSKADGVSFGSFASKLS